MEAKFMRAAIEQAKLGIETNQGGPFGAVIVKDGEVIGRGCNTVPSSNDPTSHAEINAIREACKRLNTFNLKGCSIYTSCEPCPMCLGAIYWARIDKIFYAADHNDAAKIGFDDRFFYEEMDKQPEARHLPTEQLFRQESKEVMDAWFAKEDKIAY